MISHYSARFDILDHPSLFSQRSINILYFLNKNLYEESCFLILLSMDQFIQKNDK